MNAKLGAAAIVILLSAANCASAAPVQWPVADGGNGHYYDLIVSGPITWADAKVAATLLTPPSGFGTGHLTTISDAGEDAFLATTFGPTIGSVIGGDGAWAGMTDEVIEGEWRWIDDTPGIWQDPNFFASPIQTAYTNWGEGEPNNAFGPGSEDHLSIRSNGAFNDYDNPESNNLFYLVEFSPLPEPCTLVLAALGAAALLAHRRRR